MDTLSANPILNSDDAFYLWQQGREIWNAWIQEHKNWSIDLRELRFPSVMSFEGYCLPRRRKVFLDEYMLDKLNFQGAIFEQTLNQSSAFELWQQGFEVWNQWVDENPNMDIDFSYVDFDRDHVIFSYHRFPVNGDVYFVKAKLGKIATSFDNIVFGGGSVSFSFSEFGKNETIFNKTHFGDGKVIFYRALLNSNIVSFDHAVFGEGGVNFRGSTFGKNRVMFRSVDFGTGQIVFRRVDFKTADISFAGSDFSQCTEMKFSGLYCEGLINFHDLKTSSVLNLTSSHIERPINLDNVDINYKKNILGISQYKNTSGAFRFLKSLAKKSLDHDRELEFFAQEKRSSYWHEMKGLQLLIYCLYGGISNYGRSLLRPILGLVFVGMLFSLAYIDAAGKFNDCGRYRAVWQCEYLSSAIQFSASNTVPFLSSAKLSESQALDRLLDSTDSLTQHKKPASVPARLYYLALSQNILSIALLFLLGLAIRNRFRS